MHNFFTGLQFLTRINIVNQTTWSSENFGKSVKYFTLIGAILGTILVGFTYVTKIFLPTHHIVLSHHFISFLIVLLCIILTGGLHCDGFMDTMDGIFSGRSRERMLEIMKDSCVGSNGVVAFVLLILCKWILIVDLAPEKLFMALFLMPILGRLAMVMGIVLFPYARADGLGKAFAQYATKKSLLFASIVVLFFISFFGQPAIYALVAIILFTIWIASYITKLLGGLTGDVYGAITELSEVVVLFIFSI